MTRSLLQSSNLHIWWYRSIRHPPTITKAGLPNIVVPRALNSAKVTSAGDMASRLHATYVYFYEYHIPVNEGLLSMRDANVKQKPSRLQLRVCAICSPGFSLLLASSCTSSALLKRDPSPGSPSESAERKLPKICSKPGF